MVEFIFQCIGMAVVIGGVWYVGYKIVSPIYSLNSLNCCSFNAAQDKTMVTLEAISTAVLIAPIVIFNS